MRSFHFSSSAMASNHRHQRRMFRPCAPPWHLFSSWYPPPPSQKKQLHHLRGYPQYSLMTPKSSVQLYRLYPFFSSSRVLHLHSSSRSSLWTISALHVERKEGGETCRDLNARVCHEVKTVARTRGGAGSSEDRALPSPSLVDTTISLHHHKHVHDFCQCLFPIEAHASLLISLLFFINLRIIEHTLDLTHL